MSSSGDVDPSRRQSIRRWLRHPNFAIGLALVIVVLSLAFGAGVISPYSPTSTNPAQSFARPSASHPLGTDEFGRDVLSRILHGARISLRVAFTAVGIALCLGSSAGVTVAYLGGWVDLSIMRLMDLIWGFPAILLALVIMAILTPSLSNAMLAIAVIFTPLFARLTRATALVELGKEYVEAAWAVGSPAWRVLWRHVFPNIAPPVFVQSTSVLGYAITIEAALSFLGLGAQPPAPSWGSMLASGRDLLGIAPWVALASGSAISISVIGFSLLGDGLRDALDPTLRA
jgi:peptide/nickel transport system permease protein